jgi:TolB protein
MRIASSLLVLLLVSAPVSAQPGDVYTGIEGHFVKIPLNISPFVAIDGTRPDHATRIEQIVTADLEFSGIFEIQRGHIPLATNGHREGLLELRGALLLRRGQPHFEGRLIDVATKQEIGGKRYKTDAENLRQVAHHFADEVVKMVTGEDGIAKTKILYRRKTDRHWEIVLADYDGYNPRVLLKQTVPLLYPRFVDDNKAITYTSFRYGKPDLFIRYLSEPASKLLASFEGTNYSVDWSAKRDRMAASLSKDGNAEIYLLDTNGKVRNRLTHSRAIDTSPSWSPTGREIAFTSDRTGTPQIYIMESNGSNVRRLTIEGSYNESPCWSPRGDRIAYVSRVDGRFQIFVVGPDGSGLRRLTGEHQDHEDPRWAPNGRHLVYTERRGAESVITLIDTETGGKRILAEGETPDWSFH